MTRKQSPALSIVIPTFNNLPVLKRCLESWREFAEHQAIELVVIEDGCKDDTPAYLSKLADSPWWRDRFRWYHEQDVHELKCTNRGFQESRAPLILTWQDDMFVQARWFVDELLATFDRYGEIGLLSLSRGLICRALEEPITRWEDLTDWRRLESTIGHRPFNWFRLQEVDAVIRPWVVRRECLDRVGLLDEAFRPTEWDEADLCFRIRQAGWKIATHGYERVGAYHHLGSTTLGHTFSEAYKTRVLGNGLLFHARWGQTIAREQARPRRAWLRRTNAAGWAWTLRHMTRFAVSTRPGLETSEQNT